MTPRRHALLAGRLIAACGGLDEAAQACRISRARLAQCQNPNEPDAFLPADAIVDLEAYCGEPHYSRAMVELRPGAVDADDLVTEAIDDTEESAEFMRLVRRLAVDGICAADRQVIAKAVLRRADRFRELITAAERVTS